jgi:hypothetical protein
VLSKAGYRRRLKNNFGAEISTDAQGVKVVPNCPKCGSGVDESMVFCPKCGASLKAAGPTDWRDEWRVRRREWREHRRSLRRHRRQAERSEKGQEWEKTEKHEYMFLGPLIAGLVVIAFGALVYLIAVGDLDARILSAVFVVLVGVIIIAAAIYWAILTRRRHPRP